MNSHTYPNGTVFSDVFRFQPLFRIVYSDHEFCMLYISGLAELRADCLNQKTLAAYKLGSYQCRKTLQDPYAWQ
jgi:hypothetical protein